MQNNHSLHSACRVMVMAGGTGGHVFPALSVAEKLRAANVEISWLGTRRGIEAELVPERGFNLYYLSVEAVRGRGIRALLKAPLLLLRSVIQALIAIARFKPAVVLGMGGFASGPGALAARLRGIPVIIHEQNAVAGTTNRLSAKMANRVMQGFPDTFVRGEWCGNPLRAEIADLPAPEVRFANREGKTKLLVLGGSRGARAINQLIPQALALTNPAIRPAIIHQTGKAHWQQTRQEYRQLGFDSRHEEVEVVSFIEDMAQVYEAADFVICRAGALTVSELTAVGLAALLIPFPFAIDDHQTANGQLLVDQGAAIMLQQKDLTAEILAQQIEMICRSPTRRLQMARRGRALAKNGAAQRVADVCMEVGCG